MKRLWFLLAAALVIVSGAVFAQQSPYHPNFSGIQGVRLFDAFGVQAVGVTPQGALLVQNQLPLSSPGVGGGGTVTSTAAIFSPPHARQFLQIFNAAATNPMTCALGATAVAAAAGSFTIAANGNVVIGNQVWVPSDYVSCISASGTKITILEH